METQHIPTKTQNEALMMAFIMVLLKRIGGTIDIPFTELDAMVRAHAVSIDPVISVEPKSYHLELAARPPEMYPPHFDGWSIYRRPSDFPNHIVVRRWRVRRDLRIEHAAIGCLYDTLEEARFDLREGLTNIHRELSDDPVIIETWI